MRLSSWRRRRFRRQLTPTSTAEAVVGLDPRAGQPDHRAGVVRGAEPGDVLAVETLELRPHDWGWTAIIPDTERSSYHVCTGVHPDLLEATRKSTRAVIDHIAEQQGRSRQEAYAIASVSVDLRIHEVVDVCNWALGAFLPEAIST